MGTLLVISVLCNIAALCWIAYQHAGIVRTLTRVDACLVVWARLWGEDAATVKAALLEVIALGGMPDDRPRSE